MRVRLVSIFAYEHFTITFRFAVLYIPLASLPGGDWGNCLKAHEPEGSKRDQQLWKKIREFL